MMILQGTLSNLYPKKYEHFLGTLSNLYLQKDRSFKINIFTTILDNLIFAIPSENKANFKDYFKKNVSPRNDQRYLEFLRFESNDLSCRLGFKNVAAY